MWNRLYIGLLYQIDCPFMKVGQANFHHRQRVVGAQSHSFSRTNVDVVNVWVAAMRENEDA